MSNRYMRVHTKVVFDLETMAVIESEGFDYFGPVILCEGEESNPGTQDGNPQEGGAEGGNEPQDFLVVDDRTRYRTQEDAVRGFQESGRRIAELSQWSQRASEYGLRDPNDLAALVDELIEWRAKSTGGNAQGTGSGQYAAGSGNGQPTKEQTAAIEWLKAHGVEAGLVTQDKLEAFSEQLDRLNAAAEAADNERFERHIDEGRSYLKSELETNGIKFSDSKTYENFSKMVERSLSAWINEDQARIDAFHQGGAALKALVQEGLKENMPFLNVLKNQPAANLAAQKTNAQNQRRVLTKPPVAKGPESQQAKGPAQPERKNRMDTGEDLSPAIHDKAYEAFLAATGGRAE